MDEGALGNGIEAGQPLHDDLGPGPSTEGASTLRGHGDRIVAATRVPGRAGRTPPRPYNPIGPSLTLGETAVRHKITVVGAGNVGATLAQRLVERNHADIVLIDVVEGLPQGKALDLLEAGPVIGYDSLITGSNGYPDSAGSDIVVITSGLPRKPGMSRDDLVMTNAGIVSGVARQAAAASPDAVILVVSNPLDAMAQVAMAASGFPRERVIGMAGILDTARFRTFIAQELSTSVLDVQATVLGGHADTMVPLIHLTTVGGVPVADLIPRERLLQIVQRTRDGGAEIVNLLKAGSAYYAPSAAVAQMVDAILLDKRQVLPCSVHLQGEYGISGVFTGVPVRLGAQGVAEGVELELGEADAAALHRSGGGGDHRAPARRDRHPAPLPPLLRRPYVRRYSHDMKRRSRARIWRRPGWGARRGAFPSPTRSPSS